MLDCMLVFLRCWGYGLARSLLPWHGFVSDARIRSTKPCVPSFHERIMKVQSFSEFCSTFFLEHRNNNNNSNNSNNGSLKRYCRCGSWLRRARGSFGPAKAHYIQLASQQNRKVFSLVPAHPSWTWGIFCGVFAPAAPGRSRRRQARAYATVSPTDAWSGR
jgi:hypothetical protein